MQLHSILVLTNCVSWRVTVAQLSLQCLEHPLRFLDVFQQLSVALEAVERGPRMPLDCINEGGDLFLKPLSLLIRVWGNFF